MTTTYKRLSDADMRAYREGRLACERQPAGAAQPIPTKEAYAKIAARMQALSKDLATAMQKAKELPAPLLLGETGPPDATETELGQGDKEES